MNLYNNSILINPSIAMEVLIDHTHVMNNLSKLNLGMEDIVNIFPNVDDSRATKDILPEIEKENENQIVAAAEKVDSIIIAWGSIGDSNQSIRRRQESILGLLGKFADKIFEISDGQGKAGLHPLSPKIRGGWYLVKLQLKEDDVKK